MSRKSIYRVSCCCYHAVVGIYKRDERVALLLERELWKYYYLYRQYLGRGIENCS